MKTDLVRALTDTFEGHAQQTEGGVEYWLGRDLQHLLGYAKWDNFLNVVSKAKTACEVSGLTVADHFADVGKMVDLGSGSQREVDDSTRNNALKHQHFSLATTGSKRKGNTNPKRQRGMPQVPCGAMPAPSLTRFEVAPLRLRPERGSHISAQGNALGNRSQ